MPAPPSSKTGKDPRVLMPPTPSRQVQSLARRPVDDPEHALPRRQAKAHRTCASRTEICSPALTREQEHQEQAGTLPKAPLEVEISNDGAIQEAYYMSFGLKRRRGATAIWYCGQPGRNPLIAWFRPSAHTGTSCHRRTMPSFLPFRPLLPRTRLQSFSFSVSFS